LSSNSASATGTHLRNLIFCVITPIEIDFFGFLPPGTQEGGRGGARFCSFEECLGPID
jgi:hypothetical protein